jgi:hypothetical protein
MRLTTFLTVTLGLPVLAAPPQAARDIPAVIAEVRAEVTKKTADPDGRPLPVASHWAHGYGMGNFGSDYQTELLGKGHHVLPNLSMPGPGDERIGPEGRGMLVRSVVEKLARWKAPFSLRGGNWEAVLLSKSQPKNDPGRWRNLPAEKSPLVVNPEGKVVPRISPFGAVAPWQEAGRVLTGSGALKQFQAWYPDPPRVILLSNNEAPLLEPKHDVEKESKRYLQSYGKGKSGFFKRGVMAEGYRERYLALFKGMREGLTSEGWRKNAVIVGYGAFGPPHFARWSGWSRYSYTTEERIDPWHRVWEGGSPSYYTHNWNASTDYRVHSPQVEANNWVFMLEEAYRENPDFWFELSVWDGNFSRSNAKSYRKSKFHQYVKAGQEFTPERYGGFVQYGMWLTTPRVVREFRGWTTPRAEYEPHFLALVAAVDRLWSSTVLQRFWRKGRLVPNHSRKHPYQTAVPARWKDTDRWYMLNTSLDPRGPWELTTEIPVFSLARVIGEKGGREWLLYAHAPVKARKGVEIEIPGYGKVTVDVSPAGNFYHLKEKDRSVTALESTRP